MALACPPRRALLGPLRPGSATVPDARLSQSEGMYGRLGMGGYTGASIQLRAPRPRHNTQEEEGKRSYASTIA